MATNVPVSSSPFGAVAPFGSEFGRFPGYGSEYGRFPSGFGGFSGSEMTPFGSFGREMAPFGSFGREMAPFGSFGGHHAVTPFAGFDKFGRSFDKYFKDLERTFSSELNLFNSRPSSYLEQYSLTNPIRIDAEGNRWLNCYFDLKSYKPEEVSVTLNSKERCLTVEASHEVKDKEHYIKRHYSRKVFIPEDLKIDLSKIEPKSFLTNEGLLCIEASLPKLSLEEARSASSKFAVAPTNVYSVATKTI